MKSSVFSIFLLSIFLISGCNLFNSDEGKRAEIIDPYNWELRNRFNSLSLLNVDENDHLYAVAENHWAISYDKGQSFNTLQMPDTVQFKLVRNYNNTFYAIGEYDVVEDVFWTPTVVKSNGLFRSADGNNWELILGPFLMDDILLDDEGYLHVAKYNGVSSIDLSTQTEYLNEFLFTNSIDMIRVLAKNSKGDVFAGCHDGIYKTEDNGANWIRVSKQDVHKDLDDVRNLYIDEKDRIFAITTRRLLLSLDDGESWTIHKLKTYDSNAAIKDDSFYLSHIVFSKIGFAFSYDYTGIYIAHFDSIAALYQAGTDEYDYDNQYRYNNLKTFSDGSVIVQGSQFFNYGKINPESEFWTERGWQNIIF